jgi:hypothetical protein
VTLTLEDELAMIEAQKHSRERLRILPEPERPALWVRAMIRLLAWISR